MCLSHEPRIENTELRWVRNVMFDVSHSMFDASLLVGAVMGAACLLVSTFIFSSCATVNCKVGPTRLSG